MDTDKQPVCEFDLQDRFGCAEIITRRIPHPCPSVVSPFLLRSVSEFGFESAFRGRRIREVVDTIVPIKDLLFMGKVRRGGYIFEWWIGDHPPRHLHVSDSNGKILGRVALETMQPLDGWQPPRKVVGIIRQLQNEDRL